MGQGSIHEQGLARNLLLFVRSHVVKRAHVIEPIGEFDQNHPHIIAQRQEHFAEIFRLRARPWIEHSGHFREPVHNFSFARAEQLFDIFQG